MARQGSVPTIVAVLLVCTAACSLSVVMSFAQSETTRKEIPPLPNENTPREIIYPYYSLKETDESRLTLMDRAPRPIEFTLAVHAETGRTVRSKPTTIQPREVLEIDIRKLLADLGTDDRGEFAQGSISIHFQGIGNPLGGRMVVQTREGAWNLGPVWREGESGQGMIPRRIDTLWWGLGGPRDAVFTVSNASGEVAKADVFVDFSGKRHTTPPLRFAPYEMKELSVTELLAGMKLTPYQAPTGGISIMGQTPLPVLIGRGKITDAENGKTVEMIIPLPQLQRASVFHTTGLPISTPSADSPFAGTGDYIPHVYVRNLIGSDQTLTLTIEYPGENRTVLHKLAPLPLGGYTTRDISLDAYFSELPLPLPFCSIRIEHNGPPGSLLVDVVTEDLISGQVKTMTVANEGNGYAGSLASYWGISDDEDFYVFLTNMGEKACRVGFRIEVGNLDYHLQHLELAPRETRYVNLREVRDRQEPDPLGHLLPATATEGRLFYNRLDNVPLVGCVVVLPRKRD